MGWPAAGGGRLRRIDLIDIDRFGRYWRHKFSHGRRGDGRIENACGGSPAVPQMLLIVLCQ